MKPARSVAERLAAREVLAFAAARVAEEREAMLRVLDAMDAGGLHFEAAPARGISEECAKQATDTMRAVFEQVREVAKQTIRARGEGRAGDPVRDPRGSVAPSPTRPTEGDLPGQARSTPASPPATRKEGQVAEAARPGGDGSSSVHGTSFAAPASPPAPDAAGPDLLAAAEELANAEEAYRVAHDSYGRGDVRVGRAWVLMRRAGDHVRAAVEAERARRAGGERKPEGRAWDALTPPEPRP